MNVAKNIDCIISENNYSGVIVDDEIRFLIKNMLCLDPNKRISPKEICNYLNKSVLNKDFEDF
jgi:dual specificity tyrosine-phosphorylation-regulated kinase 2/3/4